MPRRTPNPAQTKRRCCFADAVGTRTAGCSKAVRLTRQYRRTVECSDPRAYANCAAWLDCIRRASSFALGSHQSPSALPRRAAARLQSGGLLGMGDALEEHQRCSRVQDVSDLLQRALARYDSFDNVPLQPVIRRISEIDTDER